MRMKGLAALCALAGASLLLGGCPKPEGGEAGAPSGGGESRKFRIAVMPKGTAHSFWQAVKAGAEAAAKEEGAEVIWQGPADESQITEQINLVQAQITSGVDGIVLAATDAEALLKPVAEAKTKGIPVVTIDSGLKDPEASLCYIATDNVEGGRKAARALAEAIGGKGKVGLLIFQKGAKSSDDREAGFLEGLKEFPNIQLVSTLEANDPKKAADQADNMLTAHPNIAGIFAANEPNGVGAANALRQKKLAGKVKLIAYDASPEQLKSLEEGVTQGLIVQNPFQMGYLGVKTVMKAIRKQPITEKTVDSGMTVVTRENLKTPEVQKLLNPTGG
jgi:ribose transport system substrate-binding protein